MDIFSIITLFGGLGMFIYGMMIMGNALEKLAGEKLERTLESMTGNIFKAIGLGAIVTGIIQSSSATTVMVVGFVNAGIMSLKQAVGVIMGANIGTTVTAQLLRLDTTGAVSDSVFMALLKPSNLAYVAIAVGVFIMMSVKRKKAKDFGEILLGIGILFVGMSIMEGSVTALRDLPAFQAIFASLTNPILGILAGAVVTAVIQSSSASIGILQAVASTGAISYAAAIPIILGQNIGTCITAFISSVGASKNAKRTAMMHFYFNFIGSIVFIAAIYLLKAAIGFDFWDDAITKGGIANFHTLFNISVTLLFIPFNRLLVTLAEKTIKVEESELSAEFSRLDTRFYSTPALALEQVHKVIETMGNVALGNLIITNGAIIDGTPPHRETFNENENFLDRCEAQINKYMIGIKDEELSHESRKSYAEMMHAVGDFERIGDYTENIFDQYEAIVENGMSFSDEAIFELKIMRAAIEEIVELTTAAFTDSEADTSNRIEALEEIVDGIKETLKSKHISRLRAGLCTIDVGIPFLDIIHNYEKIADHCSNIAIYVMMYNDGAEIFDVHEYRKMIDSKYNDVYKEWYTKYEDQYLNRVV